MVYHINYAFVSHVGNVRSNNEDNFWCCGEYMPAKNHGTDGIKTGNEKVSARPMFGVFDGMGGESCGEMAAHLSADAGGKWYLNHKRGLGKEPENFWMNLCHEMNRKVCDYAKQNRISTMGSTAAMLAFGQDKVYACNLGDSRIYELREGVLNKISTDHILKRNLFGKAPLLQYVGIPEEKMVLEPSLEILELKAGLRYLICSDGVTDMLSEPEIKNLMEMKKETGEIVEEILNRSLKGGGRDNITMVLCEVTEEKKSLFTNWLGKCRKRTTKEEV